MIEAKLSDGTTLRFPADTPDDVVDKAVQQHVAEAASLSKGREANGGVTGFVGGLKRSIENGMSFGLADEGRAGIAALAPGTTYDQALMDERGRDKAFSTDYPITSTIGNVVGGFVNPISGGAKVAQLASRAPAMVRALLSGSAAGATGGTLAGFGEGEGGAMPRLEGAASGGALGAAGGAAIGAGVNAAAGVGGRVLHALGLRNPEVAAERHLARALDRDKTTAGAAAQALAGNPAGTPATVMDVAGRNTVNLGATVANTPGDAMQAADQFVQARRGGRPERIAGAVDDAFGGGGGTRVADDVAALSARRSADSRPAYEALYNSEAPDSPAMRGLMDDKTVKAAVARGLETQRIEDTARRDWVEAGPPAADRYFTGGRPLTEAEVMARGDAADASSLSPGERELLGQMRRGQIGPRGEQSLTSFLVANGGVRDVGGDVLSMLGGKHTSRPGLINRGGMEIDRAIEKAREAGYFDDVSGGARGAEAETLAGKIATAGRGADPMDAARFLDALRDEIDGRHVRFGRTADLEGRGRAAAADDMQGVLGGAGLSPRDSEAAIALALRGPGGLPGAMPPPVPEFPPTGKAVPVGGPFEPNRMRQIDGAKRGLDVMIGATLDPTSRKIIPGQGDRNFALTELREALLREADQNPLYPAARSAWAGPTQSMEAVAGGQRALAMNRDDLARTFDRMGDSDKEFFRIGVGRAVTDATSDPARAAGAARKMLEDRQMQARLETVIPDPAQRAAFTAGLEREVKMAATEQAVSPRANSHTRRLEAGGEDLARDPVGGTVASLLTSGPAQATRQALGTIYRLGQGINSSTADAMAKRLFETDPEKARAILQQIDLRGQTDQKTALLRQALMGRLIQGAGVAATAPPD